MLLPRPTRQKTTSNQLLITVTATLSHSERFPSGSAAGRHTHPTLSVTPTTSASFISVIGKGAGLGGATGFRASKAKQIARQLADLRRQLEDELVSVNAVSRDSLAQQPAALSLDASEQQVALGSPCTNSAYCSEAIKHSHCNLSNFTCACLSSHIQLNATTCLPPSLLGYECLIDAQCTKKVANSFCSNGQCSCHAKFVSFRKDKCLAASKINDYCLSDRQCQMGDKHSHCRWKIPNVYGTCKCPPNFRVITRDEDGFTRCLPRLGDSCLSSLECLLATPNSLCRDPLVSDSMRINWQSSGISSRKCYCGPGFRESTNKLTCERLANSTRTTTTTAPVPLIIIEGAVDNLAQQDGQAQLELALNSSMDAKHKYELFTTPTPRQPAPPPPTNQEFDIRDEQIVPRILRPVSLGKNCSVSRECQLVDPNSECRNGICDCNSRQNSYNPKTNHILAGCSANSTGCHKDTFQCMNGQCISWYFVCDSFKNCADGSDEEVCGNSGKQAGRSCPPETFQCDDGSCLQRGKLCNGRRDCADGSDELQCGSSKLISNLTTSAKLSGRGVCHPQAFQCDSGQCVPGYAFCNAVPDCADGSDESERYCERLSNGRPSKWDGQQVAVLNGASYAYWTNSRAARDSRLIAAKGAPMRLAECPSWAFTCGNGKCRSSAILCSGIDGCGDNSDEERCQVCRCPAPTRTSGIIS